MWCQADLYVVVFLAMESAISDGAAVMVELMISWLIGEKNEKRSV
jgi:hypothetical protein